jgi:hypothetical protein
MEFRRDSLRCSNIFHIEERTIYIRMFRWLMILDVLEDM